MKFIVLAALTVLATSSAFAATDYTCTAKDGSGMNVGIKDEKTGYIQIEKQNEPASVIKLGDYETSLIAAVCPSFDFSKLTVTSRILDVYNSDDSQTDVLLNGENSLLMDIGGCLPLDCQVSKP